MHWPYTRVSEWWGEEFDQVLGRRIATAPFYQLDAFIDDVSLRLGSYDLPALEPGHLRPLVYVSSVDIIEGRIDVADLAAISGTVLLYAHQIVLEDPFFELLAAVRDRDRDRLGKISQWLVELKPLAEMNVIVRAPSSFHSIRRHPSVSQIYRNEYDELLQSKLPAFSRLEQLAGEAISGIDLREAVSGDLTMTFSLIQKRPDWTGRAQLLTRSAEEEAVLEVLLADRIDGRSDNLAKLARMSVPSYAPNMKALIALRQSSEEFHTWRTTLASALSQVELIPDSMDDWRETARDIVHAEMEPVRQRLQKQVNRSPSLSAMRSGSLGLSFAGVGAAAGAIAGGDLTSGLIGAGTAKAAEIVAEYVNNVRTQRAGRAILDLALSFRMNNQDRVVNSARRNTMFRSARLATLPLRFCQQVR